MKADGIQVDLSAIESLGLFLEGCAEDLAGELKVAMTDTVVSIEKYAKHRCPVDTGHLRASINSEITGFEEGAVGTNTEYAMAVEYGTRPHDIKPREKKVLRFEVGGTRGGYVTSKSGKRYWKKGKAGEPVFAKRVKHPGTKAQPFLEPAFMAGGRVAKREFDRAVGRAMEKAKARLKEGS